MHDVDCVVVCPRPRLLESSERSETARPKRKPNRTNPPRTWRFSTPPLRVEVESLEHWLDLNA
jgi:hypothetical protein